MFSLRSLFSPGYVLIVLLSHLGTRFPACNLALLATLNHLTAIAVVSSTGGRHLAVTSLLVALARASSVPDLYQKGFSLVVFGVLITLLAAVLHCAAIWSSLELSFRSFLTPTIGRFAQPYSFLFLPVVWTCVAHIIQLSSFGDLLDISTETSLYPALFALGQRPLVNFVDALLAQTISDVFVGLATKRRIARIEAEIPETQRPSTRSNITRSGTSLYKFKSIILFLLSATTAISSLFNNLHDSASPIINIACALPRGSMTEDTLLHETTVLISKGANLILFPESALHYSTAQDLEDGLAKFHVLASNSNAIIAPTVHYRNQSLQGETQNQLYFVGPAGVMYNYTKRHFVPLFESSHTKPGTHEPSTLTLSWSRTHNKKLERNLTVSPAICLDADAGALSSSELMVVSAGSWSPEMSRLHFDKLRTTAIENLSSILFCDLGHAGVVDPIGGVLHQQRSGHGSFIYPFTPDRAILERYRLGYWWCVVFLVLFTLHVANEWRVRTGTSLSDINRYLRGRATDEAAPEPQAPDLKRRGTVSEGLVRHPRYEVDERSPLLY